MAPVAPGENSGVLPECEETLVTRQAQPAEDQLAQHLPAATAGSPGVPPVLPALSLVSRHLPSRPQHTQMLLENSEGESNAAVPSAASALQEKARLRFQD